MSLSEFIIHILKSLHSDSGSVRIENSDSDLPLPMLNPSQGHFTLPHSLYIIYIYRYFLLVARLPKREANCYLSVWCIQNQTMFEYIVSGYYHLFSLGIQEDECWNINNSTHFLVTKSWHIIFSLLYAWVDPELADQPNQAVSKPTSLARTATWKWDARCWSLRSDVQYLPQLSHFCILCFSGFRWLLFVPW